MIEYWEEAETGFPIIKVARMTITKIVLFNFCFMVFLPQIQV